MKIFFCNFSNTFSKIMLNFSHHFLLPKKLKCGETKMKWHNIQPLFYYFWQNYAKFRSTISSARLTFPSATFELSLAVLSVTWQQWPLKMENTKMTCPVHMHCDSLWVQVFLGLNVCLRVLHSGGAASLGQPFYLYNPFWNLS